jgi:hypothetical protein
MAQILQDATDKKAGASKRSSDAAANTTGLATSAAAVAASKRSRASLSSGPAVGPGGLAAAFARQGDIGDWFRLFVFYFEKKRGLGVLMALAKNCVKR